MSFETVSLLMNWLQLGMLLAILFRLASTFELIAGTQRELRRAIHHLGEHRAAEPGINNAPHAPSRGLEHDWSYDPGRLSHAINR
jgi:hypothetical protein